MDAEIKRLLKLSSIKGFKLSRKEEERLKAWKDAQEPVIVKKPRKTRKKNNIETVQNIVVEEDKTLNSVES